MKKMLYSGMAAAIVLSGCAGDKGETPVQQEPSEETETTETEEMLPEEKSTEEIQKEMALETLHGLIESAKIGKVYRLADEIYVGKTARQKVYDLIGEPERKDSFDRYTGSMGNPSYDLTYDKNDVLQEARYRGTNVERQTNLGGITVKDIESELGEPDDIHVITDTDETNYIYFFAPYELQFVVDQEEVTDHVNLRMQEKT